MKYLKTFESTKTEKVMSDLQDFCKNYMAYLSDEGFTYKISSTTTNSALPMFRIDITRTDETKKELFFSIKEIEDQLIQFLEYLKNDYTIMSFIGKEIEIQDKYGYFWNYTLEDMFNNTGDYEADEKELNRNIFRKIEIMRVSNLKPKKIS